MDCFSYYEMDNMYVCMCMYLCGLPFNGLISTDLPARGGERICFPVIVIVIVAVGGMVYR